MVSVSDAGTSDVYDLDVEDVHEYFADGHLVHNCVWGATSLLIKPPPGLYVSPIRAHAPATDLRIPQAPRFPRRLPRMRVRRPT